MNVKRLKSVLVVLILVVLMLGGISIQTMASSDKLVFGMIVKWVGTPYINAFIQGAQQKADELGVELIIQDGQGDSLKIIDLIDNCMIVRATNALPTSLVTLSTIIFISSIVSSLIF